MNCPEVGLWEVGTIRNLEASQHNSEYGRLYEGRIDQGRIPEPVGKMQLLGSEHDLCKRKGADQGNSVAYKINVMLGENQRLIGDEQSDWVKCMGTQRRCS